MDQDSMFQNQYQKTDSWILSQKQSMKELGKHCKKPSALEVVLLQKFGT